MACGGPCGRKLGVLAMGPSRRAAVGISISFFRHAGSVTAPSRPCRLPSRTHDSLIRHLVTSYRPPAEGTSNCLKSSLCLILWWTQNLWNGPRLKDTSSWGLQLAQPWQSSQPRERFATGCRIRCQDCGKHPRPCLDQRGGLRHAGRRLGKHPCPLTYSECGHHRRQGATEGRA